MPAFGRKPLTTEAPDKICFGVQVTPCNPCGRAMTHREILVFLGRFRPESFREFVRHRAERLSLSAGFRAVSTGRVEVSVAGTAELIDAFELACSLGPIDCLVLDYHRISAGVEPQACQDYVRSVA
jgi:acylphosphatase